MNVTSRRPIFRRRPQEKIYRLFFLIVMILAGVWFLRQMSRGAIESPFQPTPTPTRVASSYALEGEAQFTAGNLDAAITAYREAVNVDPSNALVWAELARVQTYSSALLTTDEERLARLEEALVSSGRALELAPDDSTVHAIRSFVLDWHANPALIGDEAAQDDLIAAEQEANRALQLDPQNTRALAFYAEILVDQQKWSQADQYIKQALERDPSLMDVHRVYAYVLESLGQYNLAIQEYDKAIALAPNLTFLYLRAGANYRILGFKSLNEESQRALFEKSLEYFAMAARVNDQLKIADPGPYLSIAKTYSQMGEYFIAARNVQKALEFQPENADFYGQLGIIYQKSKNYEGSILSLKCVVRGCTRDESCEGRGGCGPNDTPAEVRPLPLSPNTLFYYDVYGSELAALSRPEQNYCTEALAVFAELTAGGYDSDQNIANDIAVGRQICASVGEGNAPSVSTPEGGITATPTPGP
jgi:tetratricopeptide (TPR) repeat protein